MNPSNKSLTITIIVLAVVVFIGIGSYRIWGIRWWEYLRRAPAEEPADLESAALVPGEEESAPMEESEETAAERGEEPVAPPPPTPAPTTSGENRLEVQNQPAGLKVSVPSVSLSATAWVVVHEDRNGQPGNILGAQRVRPSDTATAVDLLRATVSGAPYYAMLHTDDGDNLFDHTKDVPLKDAAGKVIAVKFIAE